ncbi:tagaturonate reductase [Pontibacter akesuensis]|nr:tagaturonate reductase [Pontibacter akesuensis]GHA74829.1 altronate oxidoreductase [Pontibacter akesuensis]
MKQLNRQTANITRNYPVKVLQFGEGNFLRGFVDWIIDILNEKTDFNGSVKIIQPIERGIVHLLNQQDGLYHVLLNGIQGGKETQETRLITSVSGALNPYDNYSAYLQLAENPDLEFIISNTTEAGICFEEADTSMDTIPSSFPGKLTALLYHRFSHFSGAPDKGLNIIPCELIEKNGAKLKETILQFAAHWNLPQEFTNWINESNIFCNTLVDRIVPGFPKDDIKQIQQELGFEDNLVVKAEPFHLWVIEAPESVKAAFPTEKAGLQVKFATDLTPYRSRKVRILNGAHTALVPVAYLHGLRTVREAVEDAYTGPFIREAIFEEIIPTLDLSKEELEQFANDVIERFQNPFIHHELISIALNSVSKYKVRVLPSVLEYQHRKGQLPERLLTSLAALILFYRGEWQGEKIPLNDTAEVLAFFEQAWKGNDAAAAVDATLANTDFWDRDLTQVEGLASMVKEKIGQLQRTEQEKEKIA